MKKRSRSYIAPEALVCLLMASGSVSAHVPFVETDDFTVLDPFIVEDVPNSKAIYAYLESAEDVDVYYFELTEPTRIFASTTITLCPEYTEYSVTFAVIGPGLPEPDFDLPVRLRPGHGAVIVRDPIESAETREWFYEPYGGRYYFRAPDFILDDAMPGEYQIVVWNESGTVGDYTAVIGEGEYWGPAERAQAGKLMGFLDERKDMHVPCNVEAAFSALEIDEPVNPPRMPMPTGRPAQASPETP
jgi:hypothetical protein